MLEPRMSLRPGAEGRRRSAAALAAVVTASLGLPARAAPAEQLPTVVEQDPVQPPEPVVEEDMSSTERLDRARALYDRGRGKFETFDYIGAIELWTQAYTELPETEEFASIRAKLMFNIAAARLSAFEIDDNIAHLRQAKRLMDLYVESIGEATDDEAADARAWQEKISVRLDEAEKARKKAAPVRAKPVHVDKGPDAATIRRARALTITGAVTLSVGAAALGAMAGGLVWGSQLKSDGEGRVEDEPRVPADELADVVKRGRTANAIAISMGVVGGVLLGTGVGLLVAGRAALKKRGGNKRRSSERAFMPVAGPGLVGMTARWRF